MGILETSIGQLGISLAIKISLVTTCAPCEFVENDDDFCCDDNRCEVDGDDDYQSSIGDQYEHHHKLEL